MRISRASTSGAVYRRRFTGVRSVRPRPAAQGDSTWHVHGLATSSGRCAKASPMPARGDRTSHGTWRSAWKRFSMKRAFRESASARSSRTGGRRSTGSAARTLSSWRSPRSGSASSSATSCRATTTEPTGGDRAAVRGLREVVGVYLLVVFPLLRDGFFREDGLYGAYGLAVAALDARVRVDVEHRRFGEPFLFLLRMDAVDRTDLDAGGVLRSDAWLGDDVHTHAADPPPAWKVYSTARRRETRLTSPARPVKMRSGDTRKPWAFQSASASSGRGSRAPSGWRTSSSSSSASRFTAARPSSPSI